MNPGNNGLPPELEIVEEGEDAFGHWDVVRERKAPLPHPKQTEFLERLKRTTFYPGKMFNEPTSVAPKIILSRRQKEWLERIAQSLPYELGRQNKRKLHVDTGKLGPITPDVPRLAGSACTQAPQPTEAKEPPYTFVFEEEGEMSLKTQACRRIARELGCSPLIMQPGAAFRVTEPEPATRCMPGDLWYVGRHRLYIGDCRGPMNVHRLFGAMKADMLCTDPPYGVDLAKKNRRLNENDRRKGLNSTTRSEKPIEGDKLQSKADYLKFFNAWLQNVPLTYYNTVYIFTSGFLLSTVEKAMAGQKFTVSKNGPLIWFKEGSFVLSQGDYKPQTEFIVYGWKDRHKFYGPKNAVNYFRYKRPQSNKLHPSQKPLDFIQELIRHGSPERGIVYDPFGGSGTTMVAAQNEGRACYMMESCVEYGDTILARIEEACGEKAIFMSNSQGHYGNRG